MNGKLHSLFQELFGFKKSENTQELVSGFPAQAILMQLHKILASEVGNVRETINVDHYVELTR